MQRIEKSVRVGAPVNVVYDAWRHFENFPTFMEHVEQVRVESTTGLSHWKLKGMAGVDVEYDAKLSDDEPNKSIGWRSVEGDGNIGVSGTVHFAEVGADETLVHVVLQYFDPPAGPIGEAFSRMFQNPDHMLEEDLRRFKKWIEERPGMRRTQVA